MTFQAGHGVGDKLGPDAYVHVLFLKLFCSIMAAQAIGIGKRLVQFYRV